MKKIKILFLVTVVALLFIPSVSLACTFTWSVNDRSYSCGQTEHELAYQFERVSTTISGNKLYYHEVYSIHVAREQSPEGVVEPMTFRQKIGSQSCNIMTLPAKDATCTATGLTAGSQCSLCGNIITPQSVTAMTNHKPVADNRIPATCTDTGLTLGYHCSVCMTVTQPQTVIPALGHKWDSAEIILQPSIHTSGEKCWTCSTCNATTTETIPSITNASGQCGDDVYWHFDVPDQASNKCTLVIDGNGEMYSYSATNHAPWSDYQDAITKVIVKSGVDNVGSYAFASCDHLVDAELQHGITRVDDYAFYGCRQVQHITIPESVSAIATHVFWSTSTDTVCQVYYNSYAHTALKNQMRLDFFTSGSKDGFEWHLEENGTLTISGSGVLKSSVTRMIEPEKIQALIITGNVTGIEASFTDTSYLNSVYLPETLDYVNGAFSSYSAICFYCTKPYGSQVYTTLSKYGALVVDNYPMYKMKQLVDNDGNVYLSIYGYVSSCIGTAVTIPAAMDNVPVRSLGNFPSSTTVKSIIIEAEVDTINTSMFKNCSALEQICLPVTLTALPDYAFQGCSALRSIVIPEAVTSIGQYAFDGCISLQSINIPDGIKKISPYAFRGCTSLRSVSIPMSVTSIGADAFRNCSSLQAIDLSGTRSIGEYAFYDCAGLKYVRMPSTASQIGQYAFYQCAILGDLVIPDGVQRLYGNTFRGCQFLETVVVPNSLIQISAYDFADCTGLRRITLPDNISSFQPSSFTGCDALREIKYLPGSKTADTLTKYGYITVYVGSVMDQQVRVNSSYYNISDILPSVISGPTELRIIERNTNGDYIAMKPGHMRYTTSINNQTTFSLAITVLDLHADDLAASGQWGDLDWTLSVDGTLTLSGTGEMPAFDPDTLSAWQEYNSSIRNLVVNSGVVSIAPFAFYQCTKLTEVHLPVSIQAIGSNAFSGCINLNSIVLPNSIQTIDDAAFAGCTRLTSMIIPDSVTELGSHIFKGCARLQTVDLPETIVAIGASCFQDCSRLSSVTFPSRLQSIGEYAFDGCTSLTSVVLPDTVMSINAHGFSDCSSLTSVTLPSDIKKLDTSAFAGINAQAIIIYPNTEQAWQSILVSANAVPDGILVRFTDGENHAHRTIIPAVSATCVTEGSIEYYLCDSCGIPFIMNDGKCVILENNEWITPPTGHTSVTDAMVDPTCVSYGLTEGTHCSVCNTILSEQTLIPMTDHIAVTDAGYPATCSTYGLEDGTHCSVCNAILSYGSVIPYSNIHYLHGDTCKQCQTHFDSSNMSTLTLPKALRDIGPYAIQNTAAEAVIVPSGCAKIESMAFARCANLRLVYIPCSIEFLAEDAFDGCTNVAILFYE